MIGSGGVSLLTYIFHKPCFHSILSPFHTYIPLYLLVSAYALARVSGLSSKVVFCGFQLKTEEYRGVLKREFQIGEIPLV